MCSLIKFTCPDAIIFFFEWLGYSDWAMQKKGTSGGYIQYIVLSAGAKVV